MIRKFKIEDLDRVMKIWLETNINVHDFIDKNYWIDNYEMVKEQIANATIFVYEEKNIIKGFAGLMDNYIAGLFVEKNSQGQGIGKSLIDYIKEKNNELNLSVYKKNALAVKFYEREGFIKVQDSIDENTSESEIVMKWSK